MDVKDKPLRIGTRVLLQFRGTTVYKVIAYRIDKGGIFYSFQSEQDGYRATGYRNTVKEVLRE